MSILRTYAHLRLSRHAAYASMLRALEEWRPTGFRAYYAYCYRYWRTAIILHSILAEALSYACRRDRERSILAAANVYWLPPRRLPLDARGR